MFYSFLWKWTNMYLTLKKRIHHVQTTPWWGSQWWARPTDSWQNGQSSQSLWRGRLFSEWDSTEEANTHNTWSICWFQKNKKNKKQTDLSVHQLDIRKPPYVNKYVFSVHSWIPMVQVVTVWLPSWVWVCWFLFCWTLYFHWTPIICVAWKKLNYEIFW